MNGRLDREGGETRDDFGLPLPVALRVGRLFLRSSPGGHAHEVIWRRGREDLVYGGW